jgi:hypothetical protein
MIEYLQTYSHHVWLAVGELNQAEQECMFQCPDLAEKIRDARLKIMEYNDKYGAPKNLTSGNLHLDELPDLENLIIAVCVMDGNELYANPHNSKQFETQLEPA